jgi:hypothetical protein
MSFAKAIGVDRQAAVEKFRHAIAAAQDASQTLPVTAWDAQIRVIIQGKHLTFRYLLMTALLGKATNPQINALSLQAGAEIEGAYDARSLCHQVVVPLERELLNRALGGSNEPFLNKPARFPTLSPTNAVRAGEDRALLLTLHQVLTEIQTSEQAFDSLCIAVRYALERQVIRQNLRPTMPSSGDGHLKILGFVEAFARRSIEGQVAAVVAGTILSLYFEQFEGFEVMVHPVNQSGASSKEVADIDVKKHGAMFVVAEVKDKAFGMQDVDHAAFKAHQSGLRSILFISGMNGSCVAAEYRRIASTVLAERNVNVVFVDLLPWASALISLCPELTFATFLTKLQACADIARVKDEFYEHMQQIFQAQQS